ncbi:MAG: hypothetical protein WCC01_00400 [Acidimicrobiia bacterium]
MERHITAPLFIAGLFAAAELAWVIRLGFSPDPFSPGAATLVIAGVVTYTAIALVGMLLVRAPWARWLAVTVAMTTLIVGALGGISNALAVGAAVLSLLAIGGLAGPWLRIWLRQRPGAGAGAIAVALPLAAIGALPLAGLVSVDAVAPAAMVLAATGPVLAWAYARGFRWGLWGLRVALPILAFTAAFASATWVAAAGFIAFGLVDAFLAWSPGAADALSPVQAPLPPPRTRQHPEVGA